MHVSLQQHQNGVDTIITSILQITSNSYRKQYSHTLIFIIKQLQ